ncbi:MAG: hypothetical protein AAF564_18165 [Bacteroidota bacterium]
MPLIQLEELRFFFALGEELFKTETAPFGNTIARLRLDQQRH